MSRRTKREVARLRSSVTQLGYLREGEIEQLSIRRAWIRRSVVEGRYFRGQGEVRLPMDVFDLWLGEPPCWHRDETGRWRVPEDGGEPRDPERHASSAHGAAGIMLDYEARARADLF